MTDRYEENITIIVDELFRQTQELSEEVQKIQIKVEDMIVSTQGIIKESKEYRKKLDESNREEIFELIEMEIRRWYKKSSRSISSEKHEVFIKLQACNYRETNAFKNTNELIKKYKELKKLNDLQQADDENHKFLLFFDRVVDKVLQGYIVQFLCFLITGESYGRYEGHWNKNAVNDIEDVGNNRDEKEEDIFLAINEVKNTITNTLCFFRQSNQADPEKNEALDVPIKELKIN